MFSFNSRKKLVDLAPYLRRMIDVSTPNLDQTVGSGDRLNRRANRTLPTLLCPWMDQRPQLERCMTAVTRDLSDHGVGLVTTHPIPYSQVVLGFVIEEQSPDEPWFFLGTPRHSTPLGGGFWSVGVELEEFANEQHYRRLQVLRPYTDKLRAPLLHL